MNHIVASTKCAAISILFSVFLLVACGDESSVSSNPVTDSSSDTEISSSDEGSPSSSSSSKKASSSSSRKDVKMSSSEDESASSSSDYVLRDSLCTSEYEGGTKYISKYGITYRCIEGHWVLQSSSSSGYVLRDSLCSSDYEGWTQYIPQLQQEFICENGRWIPMSSSSVTPSSSSKYYDMSRLFVSENDYSYGEFTDPRDGQVYKTIRYEVGYQMIDSLTFFAQNLNYGKMIPGGTQMTDSTKFCYDDDPWYCENGFGGLYTWATVMNFPAACDSFAMGSAKCPVEYDLMSNPFPEYQDMLSFAMHQGICPEGWHVMNREEWAMVMKGSGTRNGASYLGGILWGSNQRGFSLLPAGELVSQMPHSSESLVLYDGMKEYAYHWLLGEYESNENDGVLGLVAYVARDYLNQRAGQKKVFGLSVRCVQDY